MNPSRTRPYRCVLSDGRVVTLRAANRADRADIIEAFKRLSNETIYARFLHHKKVLRASEVASILPAKSGVAFALVATVPATDGIDIVGGAQYLPAGDDNPRACEFAITVADAWHGSGLGTRMLASLIRRARRDGYATMLGNVLATNAPMLALARKLKFRAQPGASDTNAVVVSRSLAARVRRRTFEVRGLTPRVA